jgi:hypothetical protein
MKISNDELSVKAYHKVINMIVSGKLITSNLSKNIDKNYTNSYI